MYIYIYTTSSIRREVVMQELRLGITKCESYQCILQDIDNASLDALLLLLWLCEEFSAAPNTLQLQLRIGRLDLSDL